MKFEYKYDSEKLRKQIFNKRISMSSGLRIPTETETMHMIGLGRTGYYALLNGTSKNSLHLGLACKWLGTRPKDYILEDG